MTLDLRHELDRATSTVAPSADLVARARAAGRRRLLVRRLGNAAAAATVVAILVVGVTAMAPPWWQETPDPATGGATNARPGDAGVALAAVSLPDPAPGFPHRLMPDLDPRLVTVDGQQGWVRQFSLAVRPETTATDASGVVSGQANGPEAVVAVSTVPLRESDGQIDGHPIVARPPVADTTGSQVEYTVGNASVVGLSFEKGGFTVAITGIEGATADQLIALGNALTGLDSAIPTAADAKAFAARAAEAQQRCTAALAQEPTGAQILSVSATTVDAVRSYARDATAAALGTRPWADLPGRDTVGWCLLRAGDSAKVIAATVGGTGEVSSITIYSPPRPLDEPPSADTARP
ncbi:MAG: hypothetical protein MUF09_09250 [Candidatus Nanopelagicales bacterium]|jgi:hypothetical protein|nr:hypothetical protein [Candidatus Nanopelagicales bacterium]